MGDIVYFQSRLKEPVPDYNEIYSGSTTGTVERIFRYIQTLFPPRTSVKWQSKKMIYRIDREENGSLQFHMSAMMEDESVMLPITRAEMIKVIKNDRRSFRKALKFAEKMIKNPESEFNKTRQKFKEDNSVRQE